ncbi:MAG: IPT/TIG domain-containing protein [Candidatus Dormibacteraeota bacterium]|uniref:IPT/TIG domain-containing protein n=1 Tax=Candidatus Aeolococcus gillhamiae TaxID=3127015 RepID=A0A934N0V1_9BACT|nr:IPT/TIG domain-containing protein [Candidatus Dormibacteraeota bacterium]
MTDAASNTWTKATGVTAAQADEEIWYSSGAKSVTGVTVSVSSAASISFTVLDVTGASAPVDQQATSFGTGTAATTGTTPPTTAASEIAIADIGWNSTATPSGQTLGYQTTTVFQSKASGVASGEQAAWTALSATGTQTYGATLSSSVAWTGAIATFKAGGGPPPPAPTISGFSPSSGPAGTSVTITGTGFTGVTGVTFNGVAATITGTSTDTQVVATAPAGGTGAIVVTTPSGSASTTSCAPSPCSPTTFTVTTAGPQPHIMFIIEENKAYNSAVGSPYIIGNSSAPYINSLANTYRSATKWYGDEHGSPSDYYDLISGNSQQGSSKPYTAPTIADQFNSAGIPWLAYMEGMPNACYTGQPTAYYSPTHNPFAAFSNYSTLCGNVTPYPCPISSGCANSSTGATNMVATLDGANAPDFVWISPNMCDDMHTNGNPCPSNGVATGDNWLSHNLPAVLASSWYQTGGVIVITWDESIGKDISGGGIPGITGGHVATVVISSHNQGGGQFTSAGDLFGILHGVEKSYNLLPFLGQAANAGNGDISQAF